MSELIIGIDYSAAAHAGRLTWVCQAVETEGRLICQSVSSVAALYSGADSRQAVNEAIVHLISGRGDALVGIDCSLGIPAQLMASGDWISFISSLELRFSGPEDFADTLRTLAGGKELKRTTDILARSPFSPYNLRIYRQTWHYLTTVVAPMVALNSCSFYPVFSQPQQKTTVFECCPASILKSVGRYSPSYKGPCAQKVRGDIVRWMRSVGVVLSKEIELKVICQSGGDALDSVLCATGIWRQSVMGLPKTLPSEAFLEGWVVGYAEPLFI